MGKFKIKTETQATVTSYYYVEAQSLDEAIKLTKNKNIPHSRDWSLSKTKWETEEILETEECYM